MAITAQKLVERYQQGMQNNSGRWAEGVQDTDADWAQNLKNAKQRMVSGYQAAMQGTTFEQSVDRRGTSGWKSRTIAKQANYTNSIPQAVEGYQGRAQDIVAVVSEVKSVVDSMPTTTLNERINKASATMREMSERWKIRNQR